MAVALGKVYDRVPGAVLIDAFCQIEMLVTEWGQQKSPITRDSGSRRAGGSAIKTVPQ